MILQNIQYTFFSRLGMVPLLRLVVAAFLHVPQYVELVSSVYSTAVPHFFSLGDEQLSVALGITRERLPGN